MKNRLSRALCPAQLACRKVGVWAVVCTACVAGLGRSAHAQPAPAVYTWSWNPANSLVRVEAQVFVDESNCSNVCFDNVINPPWPDPLCGPPNPVPNFWNWSILPPVPPPAPPVPRPVPPIDWDEQQPGPPGFELGTIFIGDYCPCPTSDAAGNPPPPVPIGAFPNPPLPLCGLDWFQRVAFHTPIGLVFQNMLGHPSLMPERQITNEVFASDGNMPWATVTCFNAPQPAGLEVTGFADQVVTARGRRGLIGTVASFGTRTWEIRSNNYVQSYATNPPGADRSVAEGCATIVTQIPLEINGLTAGLPARYTFEFETLGEAFSLKESHSYLDPLFNLFIRPDADNAYAMAQIKFYDSGTWSTQFIEYAGNPPGVPSPPVSGNHNGATFLITPTASTYPVVLRLASRVRTFIEDQIPVPGGFLDEATASMKTNVFVTVFGPPVWGDMEMVPGGGDGPAYDFWMGKYEISNVEYVDFLNDAESDAHRPGGPTGRSAFMVFDPTTGDVRTPDGSLMFSPVQSFTPGPGFNMIQKIRYRPFMEPGTRYVADTGAEPDAVIGVTWLGAVKYCNWLTLIRGYQTSDRCYTEGNSILDWHPVTISTAAWSTAADLNATQRADLVANYRGFRLPMDNLGGPLGYISNQANAYNEWYKASAYDPAAPAFARIGPGGETVPAFHWFYGYGRDSVSDADGNYITSGDRYDEGVASIGHFDGVNTLANGTPTNDTGNPWGFYDLAGNVDEWGQDKAVGPGVLRRIKRTGSWNTTDIEMAASRRTQSLALTASQSIGFRVLTTFQPPDPASPPINDLCADAGAVLLTPGAYTFDSTGAQTDGPAEACGFTGTPNWDADMWFTYLAPCSGNVTMSLTSVQAGSPQQLLAAYTACPSAGGQVIACGSGSTAGITFFANANQPYLIRTGALGGITGISTLQVDFGSACAADIAPPGSPPGNCVVNVDDLLAVINSWGPCPNPANCPADVAPPGPPMGNDVVNVDDLLAVINAWGNCP